MKSDRILAAWDSVNPDQETRVRMLGRVLTQAETKPVRRRRWQWWVLAPAGVGMALIVALVAPMVFNGKDFPLTSSTGVDVTYVNHAPRESIEMDLVPRTESELLSGVDIFSGKVVKIETIKVSFSDWSDYMSILTIEINEVVRGDLSRGAQTQILSSIPVGTICSICSTIERMKVGSQALFLATPASEGYAASLDGSEVFQYSDAGAYYLSDPVRPIFLENRSGIQFAAFAWPSLTTRSINDINSVIEAIRSMIE